ncbi:hypothetical protein RCH16_003124 [Cryobacterium sp. MP_M5]|uniref:hypothetical protein n=1 Tax=unclassified Cryobacterium TaxID=2649013 RepID=UPI0018CBE203|nr:MULTISPECIES: hypothetical protein [unclassified Cryobacterium]MBG6059723.1 hypothetical protein [Cryobacterium sp. MP_M3]MEC5178095.1 hypothetical protein [Cryobacterium sp. MP_M5]
MFGRRRRVAPVIAAPAPVPVPELSDEQVFALLHEQLSQLVGAQGKWTLVPRSEGDTDVIFHGLKAHQIAASLSAVLRTETSLLRGEVVAEPTALPWTPAPISVWAEPEREESERAPSKVPVHLPVFSAVQPVDRSAQQPAESARLVA